MVTKIEDRNPSRNNSLLEKEIEVFLLQMCLILSVKHRNKARNHSLSVKSILNVLDEIMYLDLAKIPLWS